MPFTKDDLDKVLADTKSKSDLEHKLTAFTTGIAEALKGMAGHAAAINKGGADKTLAMFQKELDVAHTTLEDHQVDIKAAFGIEPPKAVKPASLAAGGFTPSPPKTGLPPIIPTTPPSPAKPTL